MNSTDLVKSKKPAFLNTQKTGELKQAALIPTLRLHFIEITCLLLCSSKQFQQKELLHWEQVIWLQPPLFEIGDEQVGQLLVWKCKYK